LTNHPQLAISNRRSPIWNILIAFSPIDIAECGMMFQIGDLRLLIAFQKVAGTGRPEVLETDHYERFHQTYDSSHNSHHLQHSDTRLHL
jgi:hypothetical protein